MANVVENDVIKAELQDGLSQVDENLVIDEFDCSFDSGTRKLRVSFTAVNNETAETIEINDVLG